MKIWLVESRAESNPHTGACKGPWYPCGYEIHRKKKDAKVEIEKLGGRGPYRAVEYVRKDRPPMIDLRGKTITKKMLKAGYEAAVRGYLKGVVRENRTHGLAAVR